MSRIEDLCCYYLALLRSIALIHQNSHWRTSGNDFYGNHLLFERIYKTAAENADTAAERFIGVFGLDTVDPHTQSQMIGKILEKYSIGDPLETSLAIEKKMIEFSQKFYDVIKKENKMSLGLDDMIMGIASSREEAAYLLQQAKGGKESATMQESEEKVVARISLLKRIKKAQVEYIQELEHKLTTELMALVVSEMPGQYQTNDITVSIDMMNKKIFGKVNVSHIVSSDKQSAVERVFTNYAHNILPNEMKSFLVGVGFVMIKK